MSATLEAPSTSFVRNSGVTRSLSLRSGDTADDPIVTQLRNDEAAAFEELVRKYGPRMLAVARRMLRCEHDAADALQNAFVSAYRSIHQFDGASQLSTWLHRIVVNACLMILRTRRRRPTCSLDELQTEFDSNGRHAAPVEDWTMTVSDRLSSRDTADRIQSLVDQLPEAYRAVVILRDIHGYDTASASRLLRTNEAVVKTRLCRARRMLRKLIGQALSRQPEYSSIA
jgi:RNA polymerase sigma-70 factor (ECF subfamily)